ncbi:MAG: hypothetical protein ACI8W7_003940 [Gammaproteobacteria bacterium]|jgi:hypothetical protein
MMVSDRVVEMNIVRRSQVAHCRGGTAAMGSSMGPPVKAWACEVLVDGQA